MLLVKNKEQLKEVLSKRGITEYVVLEERGTYTVLTNKNSGVLKFLKPYTKEEALEDFKYLLPSRLYINLKRTLQKPIQTKALKAVKHFLKKRMKYLILAGSVGSGKTTAVLMASLHLYRMHKIKYPLFISVPSLLFEKERILKEFPESDCLILDDFNRVNAYAKELALEMFLDAYNKNKYAFITTNLSGKELREYFDQHIRSRVEEQGMVVEVKDRDWRVERT